MMILRTLGSSSAGNCYILDNGSEALVIEAGVSFRMVKEAMLFQTNRICGCVISHQHNDHAKYIGEFVGAGIPTLALSCVLSSHDVNSYFARSVQPGKGYKLGGFKIVPFNARHDVPCVGYLISHQGMGKLLFVTDTMSLDYTFAGLNHIMIEANYADDILQGRIDRGEEHPSRRDRLFETHMELETTKRILKAHDMSSVENIILIHLSNDNSDADRFRLEVSQATGVNVVIAKSGLSLELSQLPY